MMDEFNALYAQSVCAGTRARVRAWRDGGIQGVQVSRWWWCGR